LQEEKGQPQGIAPTFKYLKISGSVLIMTITPITPITRRFIRSYNESL